MTRNSVLEGLSVRKLVDILLKTFEMSVSRRVLLREKPAAESLRMKGKVEFHPHRGDDWQMSYK